MPLLLAWYQRGGANLTLSTTAALLLAHTPPPGFAASITRSTVAALTLTILPPNAVGPGSGGVICGDGGSGLPPAGWPPLIVYRLEEDEPSTGAQLLVQTGDAKRYILAAVLYAGDGHCTSTHGRDFRHAVLSQLLDQPEPQMSWQTRTTEQVTWTGPAGTRAAILRAITAQRAALDETVTTLVSRGLILSDEARTARPLLQVTLDDQRADKHLPLPNLRFTDRNIELTNPSSPARP